MGQEGWVKVTKKNGYFGNMKNTTNISECLKVTTEVRKEAQ